MRRSFIIVSGNDKNLWTGYSWVNREDDNAFKLAARWSTLLGASRALSMYSCSIHHVGFAGAYVSPWRVVSR